MQRFVMTRRSMLFSLAGLLLTTVLTLWGCGGGGGTSSYTDPNASITTTKTATALIEPATLKQWMDEGKVNNPDPASRDRVVYCDGCHCSTVCRTAYSRCTVT